MRCDRIIPLDATLVYHAPTYHDIDGPAQGIKHFCAGITTPIKPLGYGFDPERWMPEGERKPMRFLTVASGAHQAYVRVLKGLDMIMAVAPRFPDAEFLVVGAREGSLPDKPANVIEVPFVPHHEIAALYGSATYYLQLSVSEGFGNALCEAMLCGCVPIVSDTGAMPRIIGDTGVVVKRRAPDEVEAAIRVAIDFAVGRDPGAPRERISMQFPDRLRATGLPSIVLDTIADL
ncbi:MAG: glycosyltransferase family 4 protein [Flavobacteriales bacterium]|nr:glycosyltransferase family 4 protein [Flavobacteriales bacterium]